MSQQLDKQQIKTLSNLDLHDIRRALDAGGYPDVDHEIQSVQFLWLNECSQFVYRLQFPSCEGTIVSGFTFVSWANGRPEATY